MLHPPRHAHHNVQRFIVAAVLIHVQEPGHRLVILVEWADHATALAQAVKVFFGKSAQIAVLQRLLAGCQLAHDGVGLRLQFNITHGGIHQGAGGEVVPSKRAANLRVRFFPTTERFRRGREARRNSKCVEQTIAVKKVEVTPVSILCVEEGPFQEAYLRQGKRLDGSHYLLALGEDTFRERAACRSGLQGFSPNAPRH